MSKSKLITSIDQFTMTSNDIANYMEKLHKNVMQDIRNIIADLDKSESCDFSRQFKFSESTYQGERRKEKCIAMNKEAYLLVITKYDNTARAKLISRWAELEQNERSRLQSRALAKLEYPQMTLAIQEAHKEPKSYHYSSEADLINRVILGTTAKKYCELNNIDRTCLRDNLTNPQIELINQLQRLNTSMIELGMDFQDRKERLEIRYAQLVAKLLN